jgi:hypothetical protein
MGRAGYDGRISWLAWPGRAVFCGWLTAFWRSFVNKQGQILFRMTGTAVIIRFQNSPLRLCEYNLFFTVGGNPRTPRGERRSGALVIHR